MIIRKKTRVWIGVLTALIALSLIFGWGKIKETRAYINAMYAYGYGFPLVIMDLSRSVITATNQSREYKAPINQFGRMRTFVNPDFKDVVRISRNSLWSHAFVDLEKEPLVFSQPDTRGRYIVTQALNMWTDDFASIGSRTTGTGPGNFLITGPDWKGTPPPDIKSTYRSSTRYAWILVQMAAAGPQDFNEIHGLQDSLKLTPLSAWGKPYAPPAEVAIDPNADTTATPFDQVRLMDGVTFFRYLSRLLKDNPAYPADEPMLKRLRNLGIEPGKDFDPDKLDPEVVKGMNDAAVKVFNLLNTAQYTMKPVNGWLLPVDLGNYGTDYNNRAFVALLGLGALTSEDAVYPSAFVDGEGKVLDGRSKYIMHFPKGGLLPSKSGVWSISAYRENFYVHNPIERYAVTSGMPLKFNADSSLDVYIQAKSPGVDKESNWLPVPPSGPFNLTIRVYQPEKVIMDGPTENNIIVAPSTYKIPPVTKVN